MNLFKILFPIFYSDENRKEEPKQVQWKPTLEEILKQQELKEYKRSYLRRESFIDNLRLADKHSENKKLMKKWKTNSLESAKYLENNSKKII